MDEQELIDEIKQNRELIKTHNRHIKVLEQQAARFGDFHVPSHILLEIDDLKEKIRSHEEQIEKYKNILVTPLKEEQQRYENQLMKYAVDVAQMVRYVRLFDQTIGDINQTGPVKFTMIQRSISDIKVAIQGVRKQLFRVMSDHKDEVTEINALVSQLKERIIKIEAM